MCELPYEPSDWAEFSCVMDRPAQAIDVGPGGAVFAQSGAAALAQNLTLPRPIIWTAVDGERRAGLVVQAELHANDSNTVILGVVEPSGQNNVLLLEEASLLDEPSDEWFRLARASANFEEAAQ
ncbi:hypothetical protein [Maricaulis alexandrii]|uniref:hypothetical protein n=1 Tax=Maricaulis alexandrii TaxID=2570354 RepID=UPI0011088B4E|nr:hypothetical protein [Maricaulis alexandrii]